MAYANYKQVMKLTQDMLHRMVSFCDVIVIIEMVLAIHGKCKINLPWVENPEFPVEIDFSNFSEINIVPALEIALNCKLDLPALNRNDPAAMLALYEKGLSAGMTVSDLPPKEVLTSAKILDKIIGYFIEPKCVQVFLVHSLLCY